MNEIKPIETVYNGYRFRSRLEARWAVFFDAIGLKYEYEKEGFTLSTGEKYLPDFYLPDLGLWAEVKPSRNCDNIPKDSSGYLRWDLAPGYKKLEQLCDDIKSAGILLDGLPLDGGWYQIVVCDTNDSSGGDWFPDPCATFAVNKHGKPQILVNDTRSDRSFYARSFNGYLPDVVQLEEFEPPYWLSALSCLKCTTSDAFFEDGFKDYKAYKAAIKAKQARFEHGETPTI